MRRFFTGLIALALCAPALAQEPAETLDSTVVEELVARAPSPGPAWWRVADADSAVWIMVAPFETPKGLAWDRSVLERRLAGANVYISPFDFALLDPRSIVGMGGMLLAAPRLMGGPKPKPEPRPTQPLEEALPAETRERFVAMREKLGHPAERYAALTPLEARGKIGGDFRNRYPVAEFDVVTQVEAAAKRHRVRITPAYRVKIPASGYKIDKVVADPAHGPACLDRELAELERRRARTTRLGNAWAEGDVRPMLGSPLLPLTEPPGPQLKCFNGGSFGVEGNSTLARRLDEEFVASQAAVIERALKIPGRSVALLPLTSPFGNVEMGLVGRRGVLVRLKAKGYQITTPPGLEGQ